MAKQQSASAASQRARKKVKKNVADGIAHVHASFNNTAALSSKRIYEPSLRRTSFLVLTILF